MKFRALLRREDDMKTPDVETDRHAPSHHASEAGQRIALHELLLSLGAIRPNAVAPDPPDGDTADAPPPATANPDD